MGELLGTGGARVFVLSAGLLAASVSLPASAQSNGFDVNSHADTPDAHVGDGICDDGTGHCTLRAAVEEANATPGTNYLYLPADGAAPEDAFKLSYQAPGATSARLEIFTDMSIEGAGANKTTISGNLSTQVMEVRSFGVYVLDIVRHQVLQYPFGGQVGFSVAFSYPGNASALIAGPEGFPADESFILATDGGVLHYSKDGQLQGTLIPSTVNGQAVNPSDVVLGPFELGHDQVYASNSAGTGGVYRYNPADGSVTRFVQETKTATALTWVYIPNGSNLSELALLVLHADEKRIAKYSRTGAFVGNLVTNLPGTPLSMIERGGVLYVGLTDQDSIVKYDLTGAPLGTFVASGAGGLDYPLGFAFAPDGELFVCDEFTVRKFDGRNGQFGNVFATGGLANTGGLQFPRDVIFVEAHEIGGPSLAMKNLTLAHGRRLGELNAAGLGTTLGSYVRLEEATVEDNISQGLGSGICNYGLMYVNRVRIANNQTTQGASGGATGAAGGMLNAGVLYMSDSLVDHNFAGHGGGLACTNTGATAQVSNTAFIANTATGGGAAVRASVNGYIALNFCTITDNLVPAPGHVSADPTPYGAGIFAESGGKIDIGNSIVAGNTDLRGTNAPHYAPDCFGEAGSLHSFTDNLIGVVNADCPIIDYVTGQPPTDLLTGDAALGPFGDNGGPTNSRQPLDGSRAIDGDLNVSPYELFQCPAGDQRYFIRPGGSRCDIGSVEVLQNVQFDMDHDGIDDMLDLDPQAYSFSFSDASSGGNTSGEVITEGEQTVAVEVAMNGVTLSTAPGGGAEPAQFSVCSDHVLVELGAGETRTVTCVTANAGPDQTLQCTAAGKATVTLTGSGTSFSGSPVTYGWASPGVTIQQAAQAVASGSFSLGTHIVTLTVSRGSDVATDTAVIKVVDTAPPVLTVPPDVTAASCTAVSIGQATAVDGCGSGSVTVTNDAPASYRAGLRIVTWRATDQAGNQTTRTQRVVVGLGDNQACCPVGSHVIVGTASNDTLTGTSGNDCILGKGAQDTIRGLGGDDIISGGDGDDVLEGGDGNDLLEGGTGQDILRGQLGNDSLIGLAGDDQCYGGDGDDVLFGGDSQDRLFGENGNDTLYGEAGSDRLEGGPGNDTLDGGSSTDTCVAGGGTDTLLACEL
jgi:CSLREA domain-containing protein